MQLRVIKKEQQLESSWSGGKTWELAIFPEGAKYLDRDFIWRLSTANSEREESSFTKLPDYDRILMVLEGDVVLAHGEERTAHLQTLEQDTFDGAVKTKCYGRLIRDYNLIYAKGCQARMDVKKLRQTASPIEMSADAAEVTSSYGIFCLEGYCVVSCGDSSEMIRPQEQAVIDFPHGVTGDILVMGEGKVILTEVIMGKAEDAEDAADPAKAGADDPAGAGDGPETTGGDSTAFEDYLTGLKLYFSRNRWAMMMRREGKARTYYDRAMSQALRKVERWYIPEAIWLIGVLACFVPVYFGVEPTSCILPAVIFTIVHLLVIVPVVYMIMLPRPFGAHMKSVGEMNAAERAFHQEEIKEDPHLERLMRKYKSDDENYFADESSPLYKLVKKK